MSKPSYAETASTSKAVPSTSQAKVAPGSAKDVGYTLKAVAASAKSGLDKYMIPLLPSTSSAGTPGTSLALSH